GDPRGPREHLAHAALPREAAPSARALDAGRVRAGGGEVKPPVSCRDLEKALSGADPTLTAAFEAHAASCEACGRELSEWRRIGDVAPSLRKAWDSPDLLPRIRQAIAEDSLPASEPSVLPARWRWVPAASIAALFLIAGVGLFVFRNSGGRDPLSEHWRTTKA